MRAVTVVPGTAGSLRIDEVPEPDERLGFHDQAARHLAHGNASEIRLRSESAGVTTEARS